MTSMFTNNQRQQERTGRYGTSRLQYLQELVTQFQNSSEDEIKEKILANLANFAYDPYNFNFLRQLNVLELFLDCVTEPNEKIIEFGVGGICNSCVDPANATIVAGVGGIPLIIQCLSSPVRNTVNYALGALYYICNESRCLNIWFIMIISGKKLVNKLIFFVFLLSHLYKIRKNK
ncbi:armadillo repeat-containing protein 7 [Medicago truncatula]|uniref:armadillo repeat-containing protein 7 n=1 Tax=Medicago truncatula TaxID=3880 RepID=UPI001966FCD7|nr:armadillo repeat-containing protein 7-like [Medicago truncatula]